MNTALENTLPNVDEAVPAADERKLRWDLTLDPASSSDEPRKPAAILKRIDEIAGRSLAAQCQRAGLSYPPDGVLLRAFKRDAEMEIWSKNKDMDELVLLAVLPICAMDFQPGPKLQEGDGKTPEGFYHPSPLYWSSNWFMWMQLTPDGIDRAGESETGSAFRLCLEYPKSSDKKRSKTIGIDKPGSAICIHGNCVSVGCLALENRDFMGVFRLAMAHDEKRYGPLELQIFPFRFGPHIDLDSEAKRAAQSTPNLTKLGAKALRAEWQALETEFLRFQASPTFRPR